MGAAALVIAPTGGRFTWIRASEAKETSRRTDIVSCRNSCPATVRCHDPLARGAWSRVPLGTVGFLLEIRTYDEAFGEVERVHYESVDDQPLVSVRLLRNQIEILR